MTTLPLAHVVHAAPGRLRMRVPAMRGDSAYFAGLTRSIERVEAVGNVYANSLTGSILIEGSSLSVTQLRRLARTRHWFEILDAPVREAEIGAALETLLQNSTHELLRAVPLAALALALVQFGRGRVLPPAVSLLLYALDATRARDAAPMPGASIRS
jgi:hypothetical protein